MMQRRTLEALAEAISHVSGYTDPSSPVYRARNPGALKPRDERHTRDEHGFRVFNSVLDGMQALMRDLEIKLGVDGPGRLSADSTLSDLATAYGRQIAEAKAWANFLKRALDDESISPRTAIKRFIEENQ
jgi:hypothetical protein